MPEARVALLGLRAKSLDKGYQYQWSDRLVFFSMNPFFFKLR